MRLIVTDDDGTVLASIDDVETLDPRRVGARRAIVGAVIEAKESAIARAAAHEEFSRTTLAEDVAEVRADQAAERGQ